MQNPTNADFQNVKRILCYLRGSLDEGLSFTASSFDIHAFSDADWAGSYIDRRSTTGFCLFLGSYLVSWSAKKQPTIARSSTETEYRALASTATEISWLQMLLKDLSITSAPSSTLWCDNLSAISLASNPVFHARSKHIEVDYHYIREKVVAKQIVVRHISSFD